MADWKTLEVQVPGKDLLEPVRSVLETLLIFLDVLKAILNTIQVFLIDFGNPIRALVQALIQVIEELFLSLKTSGVQALYHVPNPIADPNFQDHSGFDAFTTTFKQSLFDAKDFNRPQPRPGSVKGGYVLLMVQSDTPYTLIGKVQQLLKFFSKEFSTPRFEEPRNFKVLPVGDDGDPILGVADLFSRSPVEAVQLSWTLPTSAETPDTGFSDLISRVSQEFVPPKFLIEKSTINPAAGVIDISNIQDPDSAGRVEFEREVSVAGTNTPAKRRDYLRDSNGELVVKFTETIVIEQGDVTSLLGQLGTFRYIDTNIKVNQAYYYRVRAFVGDLVISNGQIQWGAPLATDGRGIPAVRWPATNQDNVVVAGKPTGILSARIPKDFPDFDVVGNLQRILRSAFSLDFHRNRVFGGEYTGMGSLTNLAGSVGGKEFYSLFTQLEGQGSEDVLTLETAQGAITYPWEEGVVRKQSARLSDSLASALLEAGDSSISQFQSLMQDANLLLGAPNLEDAVFIATGGTGDGPGGTDEALTTTDKAGAFVRAYNSEDYREALLGVVSFLRSFMGGGKSPDWIAINPLRDIVPWSGQILYELLAKVESLLNAFSGVSQEINNFIDLLTRKIETLERTLTFLISILDLIESLQVGAFLLAVPEVDGTVVDWVNELETAGGDAPQTGPGGYSAGVALAYTGTDVTAFKTAFSIIFGV